MKALRQGLLRMVAWISRWLPAGLRSGLYQLGPLTRLIRGTLNRAAPTGLSEVQIAAGLLEGSLFHLDLQSEKGLWLGTYEVELQQRLPAWIKSGQVVYDIGANIGYLTVAFARLVGRNGSVHAFEPLPENVARLQRAIIDNGLERLVTVNPTAVGAETGSAQFLAHQSGGMGKLVGSYGRQTRYRDEIGVKVVTLDGYIYGQGNPPPEWIKIDVEGGEGGVLRGAVRLLRQARPRLLMELHGPKAASAVWNILKEVNYRLFKIKDPQREVFVQEDLDWKAYLLALPFETSEEDHGG